MTTCARPAAALKRLAYRKPFAAVMIGIAMFSLAGIPPFPGFVAKFLIFKNVMAAGYTAYAVLGLVGSQHRDLLLSARHSASVHEGGAARGGVSRSQPLCARSDLDLPGSGCSDRRVPRLADRLVPSKGACSKKERRSGY